MVKTQMIFSHIGGWWSIHPLGDLYNHCKDFFVEMDAHKVVPQVVS